jgi:Nif-specific regulatory protein
LKGAVEKLEREMIIEAFKHTRGNISNASKMLASTIRKISYKADKYNIDPRTYH